MRIAQIAPLAEAVPPRLYGGTERVVAWLTDALVAAGHDVTLFASGDSRTAARLIPCAPSALRLEGINDHTAYTLAMLDQVAAQAARFDILHFHVDLLQYPLFRHVAHKCVTTLHGREDLPDFRPIFAAFPEMNLVTISDSQRAQIPFANIVGTIHHGMPADEIAFSPRAEGYLLFLGRIAPDKRPDRAIEIAVAAGRPLKIAAKVDHADTRYFNERIRPMLDHPLVEFVGEVDTAGKARLLAGAEALLFPIDWPEPFGLVMIEAMAAGTPVIAWPCGSVPEVLEEGVTGLVVRSVEEAARAVPAAAAMSRARVRAAFEARFTSDRMAHDYLALYGALAAGPVVPERAA